MDFTAKNILLMGISFTCWEAGFEGDQVTHALKVIQLQKCLILCLYLYKNNTQNISTLCS